MSGFDEIEAAVIIRSPYLWSREAFRGETEGRKGSGDGLHDRR